MGGFDKNTRVATHHDLIRDDRTQNSVKAGYQLITLSNVSSLVLKRSRPSRLIRRDRESRIRSERRHANDAMAFAAEAKVNAVMHEAGGYLSGVEFGDADVVDPGGDGGNVADGAHAECVPVVGLEDLEQCFRGGDEVGRKEVAGVVGLRGWAGDEAGDGAIGVLLSRETVGVGVEGAEAVAKVATGGAVGR